MTYQNAIDYIHSAAYGKRAPGLSRIRHLCECLGHPERELRVIHVAGTNGKGSVCSMLSSILRAAGYRVGLYTSPYIRRFNERMQVNGEPIADEDLAVLTERVKRFADAMEDQPGEFELITAIAFEYFAKSNCDVVILEVGLGGRLDATNAIEDPMLSIITDIDFDHTAILGNTIQAIAAEKAGIVKAGRPCLYGGRPNSAHRTIKQICAAKGAPYHIVDRAEHCVREMTLDGTKFDYQDRHDLSLSLLGTYQPFNATTVLKAVSILENEGLSIPDEAVRKGLCEVRWPARFELIRRDPIVICDGGHNPQGVAAAVSSIAHYFPERKVNLLVGVMEDKSYDEMIESLKPVTHHAFTVRPANPRAMSAEALAGCFRQHKIEATASESFADAVALALAASRTEDRPLITLGSLYLYHSVVDLLREG